MAPIIAPLIVVLGALGAILVIVGRRLTNIREAMREGGAPSPEGVVLSDISLAPRALRLKQPSGFLATLRAVLRAGLAARVVPVVRRLGVLRGPLMSRVRVVGHGAARLLSVVARLFQRLPATERVPQPGTQNGGAGGPARPGSVTPKASVPTTGDIKKTTGHPVRMPEPFPVSPREEDTSPLAPAVSELPGVARSEVGEDVSAPEHPEVVGGEQVREDAVVPPMHVEAVREIRSHRKRRVVGRVRTRKEVKASPLAPPPVPASAGAKQEKSDEPSGAAQAVREAGGPAPQVADRPVAWTSTAQTIPALIEEGNYGRAESLLIDILSKNPRDTEAYRLLGIIYLQRGELSQACEVFEEALRRDPEHTGIPGLLGAAYFALGEYAKALTMYQRAHSADEKNLEVLERLLTIFSRMDRRPMVSVTAKKILALDSNHKEAKKLLARVSAR